MTQYNIHCRCSHIIIFPPGLWGLCAPGTLSSTSLEDALYATRVFEIEKSLNIAKSQISGLTPKSTNVSYFDTISSNVTLFDTRKSCVFANCFLK